MRKRIGYILIVLFVGSVIAMAQVKSKDMKNEERLIEQLHYLNLLSQNGQRNIKEYDDSNDGGDEISLWSREKTIAEAKELLSIILSDRVQLYREKKSFSIAYQARVRRWYAEIHEKKSHYDNVLAMLNHLNHIFEGAFDDLVLQELDAALKLHYYSSAYNLLISTIDKNGGEREESLKLLDEYIPRFKGSDEVMLLEVQRLELEYDAPLRALEVQIASDIAAQEQEAQWIQMANKLCDKAKDMTPRVGENKYKYELHRRLDALVENGYVDLKAKDLNTQTGDVELSLLALIRSKGFTLYRSTRDKGDDKPQQVLSASGVQVLRTTVKDRLARVGEYSYFVMQGKYQRVYETVRYNKIRITLFEHDPESHRLQVVSTYDGTPVEGVAVDKYDYNSSSILARYTTDKEGFVHLPFSTGDKGYWVKVSDARLSETERYYIPRVPKALSTDDRTELNYFLDRPLYRRGQELKAGLLLTNVGNGKITAIAEKPLEVALMAYKGTKKITLQKLDVVTNKDGIAEIGVMIPDDAELERFYLESKYGVHYIDVEDYKLQYLSIKVNKIPKGYVVGQPLIIEGETSDINGNPTAATIVLTYDDNQRIEAKSGNDGQFIITTPAVSMDSKETYWYMRGPSLEFNVSDALGNVAYEGLQFPKLETDMPLSAQSLLSGENINKVKFTLDSSSQPYTSRLLGDLSQRTIKVELLSKESGEKIALGELPINGKREFSLPQLKSGSYRIRLFATDGYGKEISDTSGDYYFYGISDKTLKSDDLLWSVKTAEGDLLYGSSVNTTLTLVKYKGKKAIEYKYLPVENNVLYRMKGKELEGLERITLSATYGTQSETATVVTDNESIANEGIRLSGLDFEDDEYILPGTHFKRTIRLTSNGQPLVKAPIIVTVYDKAVADAAGDDDFWNVVSSIDGSAMEEGLLFTMACDAAPLRANTEMKVMGAGAPNIEEVALRHNFAETAFFSALLSTNDKGEAVLEFDLPDTQTKYNIKVYTHDKGFENQLISDTFFKVYSPLSIELSMPRFLTWDDTLQGEALIRNTSNRAMDTYYQIVLASGDLLAEGKVLVPAEGTKVVPFSLQAHCDMGEAVVIQAKVLSGELSDGVERRLPLISNLSTYVVATPISLYKQDSITIHQPKAEQGSSDAYLEFYLDPIMVLLTQLAHDYREVGFEFNSLFSTVYQYNVYKRLERYLDEHAAFNALLKSRAKQLADVSQQDKSEATERLADAKTLATFFNFITDKDALGKELHKMEESILSHKVAKGGFRYSEFWHNASPYLTSYILNSLSTIWKEIDNEPLRSHLIRSLSYLKDELESQKSFYHDYIDYALLADSYGISLDNLSEKVQKKYHAQVKQARNNYQKVYTSEMLRFAEYSRRYDKPAQFDEVRKFIEARSEYSYNDNELAVMKVFLAKDKEKVDEQLIEFLLKMKQATLWHSAGVMEVSEVILDKITPSEISDEAEIVINGQGYSLSPEERARGFVTLRYPDLPNEMTITWKGVKSDYLFGGVRYFVTEPSISATPTGEQLRVRKQMFVRKVSSSGDQEFNAVTALAPARKGDQLIIRYTIDAEQDLSLVTLHDPRPAGAEFGYDFKGFEFGDKLWFTYSRRDTEDRIYIDYLPRGQHTIELEATASNSGTFIYGPAEIQSTYAPEFAGNSAGGSIVVTQSE